MKKKFIMLCTTFAALVLEILPYGAVCVFANAKGERLRQTFSYFDLTPFGYANFAPFIVALLTSLLLILILVSMLAKASMRTPIAVVSAIAALLCFSVSASFRLSVH